MPKDSCTILTNKRKKKTSVKFKKVMPLNATTHLVIKDKYFLESNSELVFKYFLLSI